MSDVAFTPAHVCKHDKYHNYYPPIGNELVFLSSLQVEVSLKGETT